jgi:heavy metal sensor kinase
MPQTRRSLRPWGGVRLRLTAWYVLLLGLTLVLFSFYLHLRLERSLAAQLDDALQVAASQALALVSEDEGHSTFGTTDAAQTVLRRLTQAGFAGRLTAPDGIVWDGFGDAQRVPAGPPPVPGWSSVEVKETEWRVYSQPLDAPEGRPGGWIQVARSLAPIEQASESLFVQIMLSLPLVVVLAAVVGYFLAGRALRPIDRITRTAQALSAQDLTQRIGYEGPSDEVGRLARTFDQMLDRLQAAFERERRFTADASHELRTPLTVIKGRIDVTVSRPRTVQEYTHTLHEVGREADRLIRLANDLLFLTRLGQRTLSMQPQPVNLSDLLSAIVDQVRPLAEAKALELIEEVAPGLRLSGDPDYLIRLFLNILDNAIKYTPAGGTVTVCAVAEGTTVCVTVRDTGPGIPPQHLPHLFERFYRVEADRSRETGGTGLGLAVAAEIARGHGGTLEVQSTVGQGTTCLLRLPRVQPGAAPA